MYFLPATLLLVAIGRASAYMEATAKLQCDQLTCSGGIEGGNSNDCTNDGLCGVDTDGSTACADWNAGSATVTFASGNFIKIDRGPVDASGYPGVGTITFHGGSGPETVKVPDTVEGSACNWQHYTDGSAVCDVVSKYNLYCNDT